MYQMGIFAQEVTPLPEDRHQGVPLYEQGQ